MTIPNLKRIKVTSGLELTTWLSKQDRDGQSVMLVTHADQNHSKHVGRNQVDAALTAHGWTSGMRYTLNGGLLGHVISA